MAPASSTLKSRPELRHLLHLLVHSPLVSKSARGFLAAYIYVLVPRLIAIVSRAIRRKDSLENVLSKILLAFKNALLPNRFPTFIAKLIAGTYFLNHLLSYTKKGKSHSQFAFFISAFASSICFFWKYKQDLLKAESILHNSNLIDTTDLTTLAFVRACDLVVHTLAKNYNISTTTFHSIADVSLFTASCFVIMFSWFYYPHRLSRSYRKWITRAANMDDDFVTALRLLRNGEVSYNCDAATTPKHDILNRTAEKYGFDPSCADFISPGPIPCKLVHQNSFENCELHALWRFYRGFRTSMAIYIPLNLLLTIKSRRHPLLSLRKVLIGSARSSAFLAGFITLNWYSVCLVRTRLGPKLFPSATPQQLENTYGPGLGSLTCGLSVC